METHAHHLHHAPGKRFWHYLYEFVMLFLAVFCGFMAENWREHVAEHQHAKEYAKSLVEDLSADTTEVLDVMREDHIVLSCFDTINATIRRGIRNNTVPGSFYYYSNIATFSPTVVWQNATLTQVTQSGSLRYFKDIELVKQLSAYLSRSEFVTSQNTWDKGYRDESIRIRNQLLNNHAYSLYAAYLIGNWQQIPDSLMNINLPLQNSDANMLNEFANSLETRRRALILLMSRDYPQALEDGRTLIRQLKKEYHLN